MVAPDFSTWHAALRAQPGDPMTITKRTHPYWAYCCNFIRLQHGRVYISVPFSTGAELTDADISEVRFDDPKL